MSVLPFGGLGIFFFLFIVGLRRNSIVPAGPSAQVDQFASLRTEGPITALLPINLFLADRTDCFHIGISQTLLIGKGVRRNSTSQTDLFRAVGKARLPS